MTALIKSRIGVTVVSKAVDLGYLPRSEKKTNRFFDNRYRGLPWTPHANWRS